MGDALDRERLQSVLDGVGQLLLATVAGEDGHGREIDRAAADRRVSARNLAHYLAVRAHDLRPLQRELAALSISSLGRMEGSVVDTLRGVRRLVQALLGAGDEPAGAGPDPISLDEARRLLEVHTDALLGPSPKGRETRIMVTLPTDAATDIALLRELVESGTDLVRINLAHDGPEAWTTMVRNARAVAAECGRSCRVLVDLPGPKLRTGSIERGPCVLRVRPERDALGIVTKKASVVFCDPGESAGFPGEDAVAVPLVRPICARVRPGDTVVVIDSRDRERSFKVKAVASGACRTTTSKTAYLATGCRVELRRAGERVAKSRIGQLPPRRSFIPLEVGDTLIVTRAQTPGRAATNDDDGEMPARVPCTLPDVFDAVRPGERVLFDDGSIAGEVIAHDADEMSVRITRTRPGGGRLRAEKGMNLPDTDLHTSALTRSDLESLDWVAANADLVGMSFVQRVADIERLQKEFAGRGRADIGIVLKIETKKAFDRLPDLLFAGLRSSPFGVMVARGDLAVEVGYGRLVEVQEEILWLCEAAHVPVIWATQVLDSMAHTGMPSRAEVTDAGMGVQAECVMLNKGPYIAATVSFLGGVLERMQEHYVKKRSMLRRLRIAGESAVSE